MVQITAQLKEGAQVAFEYDMGGENHAALVARFGEEVVDNHSYRALVIAVQSHARTLIKAGKSAEEIQTLMNEWKPGTPRQVTSKLDKAKVLLEGMTPDERKALLAEIKQSNRVAA